MGKILAFAGSNSKTSINYELVKFVSDQLIEEEVKLIKLTNYDLPMYNINNEEDNGFPPVLDLLYREIKDAKALIISVNEHNGMISSFFKNVLDWLSRVDRNFLEGKKVLLMSTSTGPGAASLARTYVEAAIERYKGEVVSSFGFPSFTDNFDLEKQEITNETLLLGVKDTLSNFQQEIAE
ncbi:NADPH-dependent FMN reductase [Haloflavibacter putidus]|uniref:NAD(P)H-dependent oxidoreductase n=1 Tax=Haloflavibacter putidus TaxID=2576776 RepID=A0A507ZZD7_9FLAO|nr:NAD(P)H-dependent oxidoreductase [Haloflavibacter putidus]TQD40045.1 NAD(P)H-dependent oxidoreductase [Haloflavibacter putidus]